MRSKWKYLFWIGWTLWNLLAAALVPVAKDEAYYWMYAQHLDWGFFDHPPMVALMIRMGSELLPGTLGLRLVTALLATGTVALFWSQIPKETREKQENFLLFALLLLASPVLFIYGFITTPDAPLLFFAVFYLWGFRRFRENADWFNAGLLGLAMAGMAWSKFHGVLVVIFSLAAYPKILKDIKFYAAGLLALLLFFPYLFWQYQHDFVTFMFHLTGRAKDALNLKHGWEYLSGIVLILNPLLIGFFAWATIKFRRDLWPKFRLELMLAWGFILFFLLTTLKGHVEPHWVAIAVFPVLQILLDLGTKNLRLGKVLKVFTFVTIPLLLLGRIALMLPLDLPTEFHTRTKGWYEMIGDASAGAPVLFDNSYADAARYTFYTGSPASAYTNYHYRPSQYDLWEFPEEFHGGQVLFVAGEDHSVLDKLDLPGRSVVYGRLLPDWQETRSISIPEYSIPDTLLWDQKLPISVTLQNNSAHGLKTNVEPVPLGLSILVNLLGKEYHTRAVHVKLPVSLPSGAVFEGEGKFDLQTPSRLVEPGIYRVAIGLKPGRLPERRISEWKEVYIK